MVKSLMAGSPRCSAASTPCLLLRNPCCSKAPHFQPGLMMTTMLLYVDDDHATKADVGAAGAATPTFAIKAEPAAVQLTQALPLSGAAQPAGHALAAVSSHAADGGATAPVKENLEHLHASCAANPSAVNAATPVFAVAHADAHARACAACPAVELAAAISGAVNPAGQDDVDAAGSGAVEIPVDVNPADVTNVAAIPAEVNPADVTKPAQPPSPGAAKSAANQATTSAVEADDHPTAALEVITAAQGDVGAGPAYPRDAATLAAMPFVKHAADDAAAAVGPTSTPSDADAAAALPAALDATTADEVRAANDATVTDVTPAAQPADEPTAVNIATTPLELPTAAAKKDALASAVTTSVAIIATIAVVANLAAIKTDGTHAAAAHLAVDNDPDAMALADGPRGDEPAGAKIAASLAEEDEATQDGADIVAAPNPAIGEAACMSHPFWMTAPCLPLLLKLIYGTLNFKSLILRLTSLKPAPTVLQP
ncbi:hypothetical protein GOP47_0003997 [Adiantum capillus-veneris]|uniref:Uncharacterized protein n=1 Tax=Adiantum capillus-veneris TaxID=13818 RepID=A0A9D4ZMF9_ADICA|nr:hypothetical protein GOP47_0003997 [Adiantum capillus-veneris]